VSDGGLILALELDKPPVRQQIAFHHAQSMTQCGPSASRKPVLAIDPSTAFVSYSREDLQFVLRVAKDLKAKGAKVWMDKLDIRPGQRWEREVETALHGCSRMLVILSPASVGSSNVLAEAAFAIDEGKEVIPVLYLECKIPFRLRPFQYADFRTSYDEGLQELLATLENDRAAKTASPTAESTATRAAALTEREGKTAEEKKREEQLERQRLAAEQTRLEDERKRAATEKARLEREERERKAAEEKKLEEELEQHRLAAEQARLEEERKQAAARKARLEQEERERSVMTFGTIIRDSTRVLKAQSVPLLITGIVGVILIVGWLIYRASSSSSTKPGAAPSSSSTTPGGTKSQPSQAAKGGEVAQPPATTVDGLETPPAETKKSGVDNSLEQYYLGRHRLGVNRVGDSRRLGSVSVTNTDGNLRLAGSIRSGAYYLEISGTVEPISPRKFLLTGEISGIPDLSWENTAPEVLRTVGQFMFEATQGRKYWRMYQVNGRDCVCGEDCGNRFCYIDIDFLR
jgi:hypothetical protein